MKISCRITDVSHSYGQNRLIQQLNLNVENGPVHLISGANGSGKSTLLRILANALIPEAGKIEYQINDKPLDDEALWQEIAFVAPYQELPEEFSLSELIGFQKKFVKRKPDFFRELTQYFGIDGYESRPIRDFSTGMKQKARFILAMGSGRKIWLLDEPGSNLDSPSTQLLHRLLLEKSAENLIIMASNDPVEMALGTELIRL